METKQQLLDALQEEFERWEQLLRKLNEDEIVARDLPSGLSIKDVMAHLMAWQRLSLARLKAALDNADPVHQLGPVDLDPDEEENLERINAWIHETYLNEPWQAVYALWREGFQSFLELAKAMPNDVLSERGRYPWLGQQPLSSVLSGSLQHHHEEHYEPLTEWLREHGSQR